MNRKYFLFCIILLNCNSLEKERLDLEKDKLALARERLEFEKTKSCCCNSCKSETKQVDITNSEMFVEKKSPDCGPFSISDIRDIWELSIEGDWYYAPDRIKQSVLCKNDKKEFFYKQFANTDSYVAESQVPSTKKSSCINNVLFSGKSKLYNMMIERTIQNRSSEIDQSKLDTKQVTEKLIHYNTSEKGRSFYYECQATDKLKRFDSCKCVLYASFPKGEDGLLEIMK